MYTQFVWVICGPDNGTVRHAIKIRCHGLSRQLILFEPIQFLYFFCFSAHAGYKVHTAPETLLNAQPHSLYTIQSHTYSTKTTTTTINRDESSSHNICKFTTTSTTNTATSTTAAVTQSHFDEYNNCSTAWRCTDQYNNEQANCNWTTATAAQWPITTTTTTTTTTATTEE